MREIRQSGSEGGGAEINRLSLPLSLGVLWLDGVLKLSRSDVTIVFEFGFAPPPRPKGCAQEFQSGVKPPQSQTGRRR